MSFLSIPFLILAQVGVDFASTIISGNSRNELVIDASKTLYKTSAFFGTKDFDPGTGTFNLTSQSGIDPFVLKMDSNGDFVHAFSFPSANTLNHVNAIAVDQGQNIYLGGKFRDSLDVDPATGSSHFLHAARGDDIFFVKIDSSGSFDWAFSSGAARFETLNDIVVDPYGNVYITGEMVATLDINPNTGVTSSISSNP